jgi:segregation and condensation protein A
MNIYDISIVTIADQFLSSIKDIEKLQLEIAADFINLASYLVFLKSKMLLPSSDHVVFSDINVEEEKFKLGQRLLEYSFYRDVAIYLDECEANAAKYLKREVQIDLKVTHKNIYDAYTLAHHYFPLVYKENKEIKLDKIKVNFKDVIAKVKNIVLDRESLLYKEIVSTFFDRYEIAASLIAMLELVKIKFISALQKEPFEDIYIFKL